MFYFGDTNKIRIFVIRKEAVKRNGYAANKLQIYWDSV